MIIPSATHTQQAPVADQVFIARSVIDQVAAFLARNELGLDTPTFTRSDVIWVLDRVVSRLDLTERLLTDLEPEQAAEDRTFLAAALTVELEQRRARRDLVRRADARLDELASVLAAGVLDETVALEGLPADVAAVIIRDLDGVRDLLRGAVR